MIEEQKTTISWLRESVIIKMLLIGVLTLLLLIPSFWVQNLVQERQGRQQEVIGEISDKWSGSQQVEGPILVLPYKTTQTETDASGKTTSKLVQTNIYILPEDLKIDSKVSPQVLHRGIFDAIVYDAKIKVRGTFSALELKKSGIDPTAISWNEAKIVVGLSDLKGLKNNPSIKVGNSSIPVEPGFSTAGNLFTNSLVAQMDLSASRSTSLEFSMDLDIRGSAELNFLHLGKSTSVGVTGTWNNPSFSGRYLPEQRQISKTDFSANWKLPYFNRPYPQQWVGDEKIIATKTEEATFGVKFILPVDQYQKTMRSAKYAVLIIVLTFIALFFTEIINKKKVHFLQYILIGVAMIIYYTLLLSFTEQVGFVYAYLIASIATIALVSTFIASVLKNKKIAASILAVFYLFIYVIIQLQDLALLFGSIGLFVIVAFLMYFSSKIDWDNR
jgi:inner membrane protein